MSSKRDLLLVRAELKSCVFFLQDWLHGYPLRRNREAYMYFNHMN